MKQGHSQFRRVYFPFADGTLTYDCAACGHWCCKGGGFGLPRAELAALNAEHDGFLDYFALPTSVVDYYSLAGVGQVCPFLRADGQCVIHLRQGWEHKPYICRVFPVNQFVLVGDVLFADLHDMCPATVAETAGEPGGAATASSSFRLQHAELTALVEHYSETIGARTLPVERIDADAVDAIVDHEEALRDRLGSGAATSFDELLESMSPSSVDQVAFRRQLEGFERSLAAFLHVPTSAGAHDVVVERALATLATRLRAIFLLRLPRVAHAELQVAFPRLFLVMRHYLRRLAATSSRPLTSASAYKVVFDGWCLFWLLAHHDRVPRFDMAAAQQSIDVTFPVSQEERVRRFVAYVFQENPAQGTTLEEVLERIQATSLLERLSLLRSIKEPLVHYLKFSG